LTYSKGYYAQGYPEAMKILESSNVHASEYSSVGLEYDHHIENNGTIDELHRKIDSIVNL
jgi:hypothetical protein